jgi:hypothetical protein
MTQLDVVVERTVETYRKVFLVAGVIGVGSCLIEGDIWAALIAAVLISIMYYIGLYILGFILAKVLPPRYLIEELRTQRINDINRRLDEGTLEAGSEELETLMTKAGLEPLHVISGYGPVFGRQFDAEMYEWLDAKKGREGDLLRYVYVGQAQFDSDGCVETPNDEGVFLVLDGFLYEHTPEPKNSDVQQPQSDVQ